MKDRKKYIGQNIFFLNGIIALVVSILFTLYLFFSSRYNLVSSISESLLKYYVLMGLFVFFALFAVKDKRIFFAYVLCLFGFFIWVSFADVYYSAIDETMNYENINHIISEHRLSTFYDDVDYNFLNESNDGVNMIGPMTNYEAVQAPLYYILFSVIGGFISHASIRFHIFRLISLFMVWIIYFFVSKIISLLKEHNFYISDEMVRAGLLLTLFNPGYLYRASRLNNEILICVLCSAVLFVAIKCILEGYSNKSYWVLAFLCISCFMTKNTAIYVYGVLGIVAILQNKIKNAILPTICSFIPTVPWFIFNYNTYGSLTAMEEHLNYVIPIVNPEKVPQDLMNAFFCIFPETYFTGEEMVLSRVELVWINTMFIVFCFITLYLILEIFNVLRIKINNFNEWEQVTKINSICLVLMIGCLFCLTVGTISTKVVSLRGRYFYGPSIGIIILLALNFKRKCLKKIEIYFCALCIIIIGVIGTRSIVTFGDRVYNNMHLFGSEIKEIELCDLTDENWIHGYSKTENKLLINVTDNKDTNYGALIGHTLNNGFESSVITGVSDISVVGEQKYLSLITDKHFNVNNAVNNKIILGRYCKTANYNPWATYYILENIEDGEVSQSLRIKENGSLWGCSVNLGTYASENYNTTVDYKLLNENGEILQHGTKVLLNVVDNSYATIYFEHAEDVIKNQTIVVSLMFNNDNDLPLAIKVSTNDAYIDGSLKINDEETEGLDLGINLLVQ